MNYIIYADVMIFWNFLINTAALVIASRLMNTKLRIIRLLICSFITALITGIIYIMLIDSILLPLLYSAVCIFMTIIYFKTGSLRELLQNILAVVISMPVIYGLINIFKGGGYSSPAHKTLSLTAGIYAFCFCTKVIYHKLSGRYQKVILKQFKKSVQVTGYYDTGNTLLDSLTQKPVMIIDCRLFQSITPSSVHGIINIYQTKGFMDYDGFVKKTGISIHPVLYSTVNSSCELMPVFYIDSMQLVDEQRTYSHAAIGISRYTFKKNFQILLNENIL